MSRALHLAICLVAVSLPPLAASAQSAPPTPAQSHDVPGQAESQQREGSAPTQQPEPLDSILQIPLLAHWAARQRLAAEGLNFTAHFIAEPAINGQGYRGAGPVYTQQFDFGAVFDLNKLGLSDDGKVTILLSDRAGRGLQQDKTGSYNQDQAFYGQGRNFRFDELSYNRSFVDDKLNLHAGFYSMGNDFAGLPYTCNFTNNGNCGHPLGLLYGSGWTDSPTGQWGARLKWTDPTGVYAETGLYDVTPLRKADRNGFNLTFNDTTGVIAPLEIGYVYGKTAADYAGTYKVGVYYDSSTTADLAYPTRQVHGRGGGYVQAAQQIWKPRPGVSEGLAVFAVATLNDPEAGLFRTSYEGGLSWRAIVPSRENDVASVGWVQLDIDPRLRHVEELAGKPGQHDEDFWEVNYGAQIAPWLLLRPTLQYVLRPSGYETRPSAFVFVLHLQATL